MSKYYVYHRSMAGSPDLHKDGEWYFNPEGYDEGDIFSRGFDTAEAAQEACEEWASNNDEDEPEIEIGHVRLQWGIADGITPDPAIFIDGPGPGKHIDVSGYNAGDYWGDEGFMGPDIHGIVPIWTNDNGTQFPPHAKIYPHLC